MPDGILGRGGEHANLEEAETIDVGGRIEGDQALPPLANILRARRMGGHKCPCTPRLSGPAAVGTGDPTGGCGTFALRGAQPGPAYAEEEAAVTGDRPPHSWQA